jgi:hypothetical protein
MRQCEVTKQGLSLRANTLPESPDFQMLTIQPSFGTPGR